MNSARYRYGFTRAWLNEALSDYRELSAELAEAADDEADLMIKAVATPDVLMNLSAAARAHAVTMQRKMDDIYWRDLTGNSR